MDQCGLNIIHIQDGSHVIVLRGTSKCFLNHSYHSLALSLGHKVGGGIDIMLLSLERSFS